MRTTLVFDLKSRSITTMGQNSAVVAPDVSAVHCSMLADLLYVASGTEVRPLFQGSVRAGFYRSRIYMLSDAPSFGWLRVEGPIAAPGVIVRMFGNGALHYTTPALVNEEPVRLPPGRFREVFFEIQAAHRLTRLVVASSSKELSR